MAKINLLPWRQVYREEKKREFLGVIAIVFIAAALGAYTWVSSVEASIENQESRNRLLEQEIAKLDAQVKEISELKKIRDDLLARIKVIQDLEGTRPVIVRYFDDFARAIPDGVYITMMDKKGTAITIEGVAESYNRVASFMRNLDASDWFAAPNLTSVTAAPEEGEQASKFKMTVLTSAPVEPTADAAGNTTGAAK
jgi:type IV pilus assembly protein PilN